jgi:hypothetical protein
MGILKKNKKQSLHNNRHEVAIDKKKAQAKKNSNGEYAPHSSVSFRQSFKMILSTLVTQVERSPLKWNPGKISPKTETASRQ